MAKTLEIICGFIDCDTPVICGLKSKTIPGLTINVCREHFIEMMHREPTEEEIGLGQLMERSNGEDPGKPHLQ